METDKLKPVTLPVLSNENKNTQVINRKIKRYSQTQQQCIIDIRETIQEVKERVQTRLNSGALTQEVTNGWTKETHKKHQSRDENFINNLTGYLEEITSKRLTVKQLRALDYSWLFNSASIIY